LHYVALSLLRTGTFLHWLSALRAPMETPLYLFVGCAVGYQV